VEVVLIHDAARPLCSPDLVQRVLDAAEGIGAVAALPASDTIHEVAADQRVMRTLDRAVLWQAQTPQAFPRELIIDAHRRAQADGVAATDDAALVVHYGGIVQVVQGEVRNLKITVPEDLLLAETLLAQQT
jgi:2-C-methyl-D-erythritol 4-phosphate cytidylyltransferase